MDQAVRNKLRNVVTQCRKVLEDATAQALQGRFGVYAARKKGEVHIEEMSRMGHLSDEDRACRQDLIEHLNHIQAICYKPREALDQLVREIAFTHLNRLCAYKIMETRGLIREAVSRGMKSQGFFFYLADHSDDEKLHNSGQQDVAYRHFLDWLGGTLSEEIGVLFNPNDPANRTYPPQRVLDEVLDLINGADLNGIWTEDETIGWVYQYFTPKELREQARKESQAPRNSYELAFRNQFFTPRYVVEFLTDNTLGRIWYEMRKGETTLKDRCRYLVRRPKEIFLKVGEGPPPEAKTTRDDLSQEELLEQPVYIPHRPTKDPREIRVLDPACGSGHFLLYCFDLLQVIYEEAYADPDLGPALKKDYPTLEDLRRFVPGLILKHNLHGIDIDLRATQIAALALWLRCQRVYQGLGLKNGERPKITRSNIVCAEPMPGEADLLKEFTATLQPKVLGQLVEVVFEKMKLAGEAGSLLKIEEEVQEAVATAKKEYQAEMRRRKKEAGYLPGMAPPREATIFDFADMTDEAFLDRGEEEIVAALRKYAEQKANGKAFRRRLFAEDAARGFAFVDLCRKRFDVVLMNPPFGESSTPAKSYIDSTYSREKHDIGMAFVTRYAHALGTSGYLGVLASRACLANEKLSRWRRDLLLGAEAALSVMGDLGIGVLDEALVEVATYVIGVGKRDRAHILSCLDKSDKEGSLLTLVTRAKCGKAADGLYVVPLHLFDHLPSNILSYTLPLCLLRLVSSRKGLKESGATVKQGLQTADDFRFYRLFWEAPANLIAVDYTESRTGVWCPVAKGGEYEPFYADLHLVIDWEDDGRRVKDFIVSQYPYLNGDWAWVVKNSEWYFKGGLTFPERTTSGFSPRIMAKGVIFTAVGMAIFANDRASLLGYLLGAYTRPYKVLVGALLGGGDSSVSGSAAKHIRSGLLNALPHPYQDASKDEEVLAERLILWRREWVSLDEATRYFTTPYRKEEAGAALSLRDLSECRAANYCHEVVRLLKLFGEVERRQGKLFGMSDEDWEEVGKEFGAYPSDLPIIDKSGELDLFDLGRLDEEDLVALAKETLGARRQITKKEFVLDRRIEIASQLLATTPDSFARSERFEKGVAVRLVGDLASTTVSYGLGCCFGRWDVRITLDSSLAPKLPDPFGPLPVCPPGILQSPDGLPAKPEDVPPAYPIRIDWDGVLVDDPEHEDDIVRRVRDVLEAIWKDRADAIENEACEILGFRELRDYFRRPGNGGFWMDHVKRYSKSRRKAPIYWYLRSAKGNYGLWLYYHRLDKDMLFKALLNYVEPKIRLEDDRLNTLRARKEAVGSSGREAKQIEKEMDRQEQFLSELNDFKDKLRRAADLHLMPDLNDGVVLNIAPLWELVPWKEVQQYWEELSAGKYEWSSIGKQLRKKELVRP